MFFGASSEAEYVFLFSGERATAAAVHATAAVAVSSTWGVCFQVSTLLCILRGRTAVEARASQHSSASQRSPSAFVVGQQSSKAATAATADKSQVPVLL